MREKSEESGVYCWIEEGGITKRPVNPRQLRHQTSSFRSFYSYIHRVFSTHSHNPLFLFYRILYTSNKCICSSLLLLHLSLLFDVAFYPCHDVYGCTFYIKSIRVPLTETMFENKTNVAPWINLFIKSVYNELHYSILILLLFNYRASSHFWRINEVINFKLIYLVVELFSLF